MMALPLIRFVFCPAVLKRIWETLRYPSETTGDLPSAEVLSIVVSEEAKGKGVGKALMKAVMDEFANRRIRRVRVAVWDGNEPANRFYQHCGFSLATVRKHHGFDMNIYTTQTDSD